MRPALASLAVAFVATALTPACWSAELPPSKVARTLDITSLPNRLRLGLRPETEACYLRRRAHRHSVQRLAEISENVVDVLDPDR